VIRRLGINPKLPRKELYLMEGQLTRSAVSIGRGDGGDAPRNLANRVSAAFDANTRTHHGAGKPRSAPAGGWAHTLVLTGELTRRSAHALELEIEDLCAKGVTAITLDLRRLAYIDSVGVAVISFRCGLCQRQGHSFALVPGPRLVQRAFEQAGIVDLLPFDYDAIETRRLSALVISPRSCDA
jgi:anti-anti-sigma factor